MNAANMDKVREANMAEIEEVRGRIESIKAFWEGRWKLTLRRLRWQQKTKAQRKTKAEEQENTEETTCSMSNDPRAEGLTLAP